MSQSLEEHYEDLMSCSQIPGRGWLGAAYAVYNRMEKLEKEEEKKAKDKESVVDLTEGNDAAKSSKSRSRSPKQKAGGPNVDKPKLVFITFSLC